MMTETVVNVQEAPNNNAAKTNAQSDGGGQLSWLKINLDHFRIIPGQLKIVQVVRFRYQYHVIMPDCRSRGRTFTNAGRVASGSLY